MCYAKRVHSFPALLGGEEGVTRVHMDKPKHGNTPLKCCGWWVSQGKKTSAVLCSHRKQSGRTTLQKRNGFAMVPWIVPEAAPQKAPGYKSLPFGPFPLPGIFLESDFLYSHLFIQPPSSRNRGAGKQELLGLVFVIAQLCVDVQRLWKCHFVWTGRAPGR
jgi:hypothetical protein